MLSKKWIIIMACGGGAAVLGTAIGLIVHFTSSSGEEELTPGPRKDTVANCYPEGGGDKDLCLDRGCSWEPSSEGGFDCVFPTNYGYDLTEGPVDTPLGYSLKLKRREDQKTLFGNDVDILGVDIEFHTETMARVKIYDSQRTRYEVPKEAVDVQGGTVKPDDNARLYDIEYTPENFGFKIIRKSSKAVLFDTTVPGLVFSDQYIHVTTRLSSSNVYGFGEHNHRRFKHDMNFRKWTMFTRDVGPIDAWNLYGHHAYYMNIEADGSANGVLLLNSNAMDVVLQPDPYPVISYHTIGGVLDFYFFLGPTPENVVQQYTLAVGRPLMPPYWTLGFQLCRWDYDNITHVGNVVQRNLDAGIPLDVMYGDIDYMESKLDFTYDKVKYNGLPEFVDELHEMGMKYIIILDHCIGSDEDIIDAKMNGSYPAYTRGKEMDIFVKDASGQILEGEVWPGLVHYPDFSKLNDVTDWWTEQCVDFYNGTRWGVEYDALWIDMNEPSNFIAGSTIGCQNNKWNNPPFVPNVLGAGDDGRLYDKTICMDAEHEWGKHYDTHSLYGHSMSITSWNTLREMFPDKRPMVLTRSQFTGSQKYAAHWLGDNQSRWENMPWSIIGMMEYSLFGFSYTGADICGFWYATTEALCQRWMQLGAFYPYARNHNGVDWPDQDPAVFSPEMQRVSREILEVRYKLLPFLYTLMYEAHAEGSTVVRPLLHEYPTDTTTHDIDRQFLWGPSLLISPALDENQVVVRAYFPKDRWFDYFTGGEEVTESQAGVWKDLDTPMDKINLHIRGGHILPWQHPANNTRYSRQNPMGITVALGSAPTYASEGSLYWDDGESFETHIKGDYLMVKLNCIQPTPGSAFTLDMTVENSGYSTSLQFDTVEVLGVENMPTSITVDGSEASESDVNYDATYKKLILSNQNLHIGTNHEIRWTLS